MKKIILSATAMFLLSPLAQAQNVELKGDAARSFIERHFPNADIPGEFKGTFNYINKNGETKRGYAECFYPAMGAASEGAVPSCSVIY